MVAHPGEAPSWEAVGVIKRPCRCCGASERTPPRDPAWARWTGELNAGWPSPDGPRQVAPENGAEVEIRLRGPFELGARFGALFVPWPAAHDGLEEHPELLGGVRAIDLATVRDLGDVSAPLLEARILVRVLAVHTLDDPPRATPRPIARRGPRPRAGTTRASSRCRAAASSRSRCRVTYPAPGGCAATPAAGVCSSRKTTPGSTSAGLTWAAIASTPTSWRGWPPSPALLASSG
jgi:hypothetical protein